MEQEVHNQEYWYSKICKVCPRAADVKKTKSLNTQQMEALYLMLSGRNVFLTGEAGTGKSYVVQIYKEICEKAKVDLLVTAPTGIAAINVDGMTIHRAFKLPANPIVDPKAEEVKISRALDGASVVLIDEISMCRADVFDAIACKLLYWNSHRGNTKQLIVVGDFFQLPPVVKPTDRSLFKALYPNSNTWYAFEGNYWDAMGFTPVALNQVVRQDDTEFIENLNKARRGDLSCLEYFNRNCVNEFDDNAIELCPTNDKANDINRDKLDALPGYEFEFRAIYDGDFKAKDCLAEPVLALKKGCRVMALCNDQPIEETAKLRYSNGSMGTVSYVDSRTIMVDFDNGNKAYIEPFTWKKKSYSVEKITDPKTLETKNQLISVTIGACTQIPLKLAYAITIHKSQGQTYEKENIHPETFATGQLYVALSRASNKKGLHVSNRLTKAELKCDPNVIKFYDSLPIMEREPEKLLPDSDTYWYHETEWEDPECKK